MQRPSRLNRTTDQKTKKQIIIFAITIIVVLFIFFQFGPSLLSLISNVTGSNNGPVIVNNDKNTLESPFINSIPSATDSASITIAGTSAYSDAQVELYVNGDSYDTVPLSSDQSFEFEGVKLKDGINLIKARVEKGDKKSNFTQTYNVIYSQGAPKLDVSSPSDNQEFTRGDQTITVQGTTDPDNNVTVNNFRAVVDGSGNFSYYLNLSEGDNNVVIVAQSQAGKKTEKTLKVKYKP